MSELSKIYARRQTHDALRLRNGPITSPTFDTPLGSDVLVWREQQKKWTGVTNVLGCDLLWGFTKIEIYKIEFLGVQKIREVL